MIPIFDIDEYWAGRRDARADARAEWWHGLAVGAFLGAGGVVGFVLCVVR